jgi:NADH:ubiquinone oxidoreductase subunit K
MSGLTVATWVFAMTALPNDAPYPFTGDVIAAQWPGDYLWMYPAMVLMLVFVAFFACVHDFAPPTRKVFTLMGLCLAAIAAAVLLVTYFVQVTVMQPSLEKGQLDGWSILTMYNPNGVFIAAEELGYLLMSLALVCLVPVFTQKNRVERTLRWLLVLGFASAVAALVGVSAFRGIDRGDIFEILVISIVWLTMIIAGPLVAVVFRRAAHFAQDRSS